MQPVAWPRSGRPGGITYGGICESSGWESYIILAGDTESPDNGQRQSAAATAVQGPEKTGKGGSMAKRTTHRSKSGKKLYAVRDKKGRFKDIQTYKRAHGMDIKRKAKKEKRKKK
jgi:hypothetical protein